MGRSRQERALIGRVLCLSSDLKSVRVIFNDGDEKEFSIVFEKSRPNRWIKPVSEEQWAEILSLYKNGCTIRSLVAKYKKPEKAIRDFLVKNGANILERPHKYKVNEDFFEEINSEEKAYLLGFLMADGNIFGNRMGIILHKKDIEVLDFFRKNISPTRPIGETTNRARFSIRSEKLVRDLTKHGCGPKKSLTLKFPDHLNKNLMPHFIRGYFDGDGWITFSKSKECQSFSWEYGIVSSYDFCEVLKIVMAEFGIRLRQRPFGKVAVCRLSGNKTETLKAIYSLMYDNATLFLKRKKEKMEEILQKRLDFLSSRPDIDRYNRTYNKNA